MNAYDVSEPANVLALIHRCMHRCMCVCVCDPMNPESASLVANGRLKPAFSETRQRETDKTARVPSAARARRCSANREH